MNISQNITLCQKENIHKNIVEAVGYNISDFLLYFADNSDIDTSILYNSEPFDGIFFWESPIYHGIKATEDHSSLKKLFYNIAGQYAAIDSATWFLITNKTPEEMRSFISWYETEFERRDQIDTLFIMYELNPSYDYHYDYDKISINGFDDSDEESLEDEWLSLKDYMQSQEYDGPFPPATLYQKLKEEIPDLEFPGWFMTGNVKKNRE